MRIPDQASGGGPIWRIEMFGVLRAIRQGGRPGSLNASKMTSLLGYLAYYLPHSHRRERIADALWPQGQINSTRASLNNVVSRLRFYLEPEEWLRGRVLVSDRWMIGLDESAVATDTAEFERSIRAASRSGDLNARTGHLEHAITLYKGELLTDFYDEWLMPERRRLSQVYYGALLQLAGCLEQSRSYQRALHYASRARNAEPLNEESYRRLIRLHTRMGQPSAARYYYQDLKEMLEREFGGSPSVETEHIMDQLVQMEAGGRIDDLSEGEVRDEFEIDLESDVTNATVEVEPESPDAGSIQAGSVNTTDRASGGGRTIVSTDERQPSATLALEAVGAAVPLDSQFYVLRGSDHEFHAALDRGDSVVLVQGPRQVGKTSLLARGLQRAREAGSSVILSDFRKFGSQEMESAASFLRALAESMVDELELDIPISETWLDRRSPGRNFERFVRRELLTRLDTRVVWGIDEADRLFRTSYCSEVFGLFRSWYNERALNPAGPWSRFTAAIAYATEAHLFISDINLSPFNVGTQIRLEEFTGDEVADLNRRYGYPLQSQEEITRFGLLMGGHPHLTRRALNEMMARGLDIAAFEVQAVQDDGLFADHLNRLLGFLTAEPALVEAVRDVLHGRPCPNAGLFSRLRSAGVLSGHITRNARLRCGLYTEYLQRHLG